MSRILYATHRVLVCVYRLLTSHGLTEIYQGVYKVRRSLWSARAAADVFNGVIDADTSANEDEDDGQSKKDECRDGKS